MKLAKIILPMNGNDGQDLWSVHQKLKHGLLDRWGGYTSSIGTGAWLPPGGLVQTESHHRYEVAMERADVCAFRDLAAEIASLAGQHSVMIVTPCGDVEFVKPKTGG